MALTRIFHDRTFLGRATIFLCAWSAHCSSAAGTSDGPADGGSSFGAEAAAPANSGDDRRDETPDTSVASGSIDDAEAPSSDAARPSDADAPSDGPAVADAGDASKPPYKPCPTAGTPCLIMPLGDSITNGYNSTSGGGYRVELLTRLWAAHPEATFVGDQGGGPATLEGKPFPKGNEGFDGYTIYDAPNLPSSIGGPRKGIAPGITSAALAKYKPNIVLLMIGTNDVGTQNDLPNLPMRLASLVDIIVSGSPNALLVVAQILPLGPPSDTKDNDNAQAYNAAIPGVVKTRVDAGKHIVVVNMYSAMTAHSSYATQLMNGLHPNDAGYVLVGDTWYDAVAPYL